MNREKKNSVIRKKNEQQKYSGPGYRTQSADRYGKKNQQQQNSVKKNSVPIR